jgi:glycosyltransferase involved in cell wall biosynthesis
MDVSGGGERQAIMFAKTLKELGHEAVIYTSIFDPHKCFPKEVEGLKIVALPKDKFDFWRNGAALKRRISFLIHENRLAKAVSDLIDQETEVLQPNDNWGCHVAYYFKKRNKKTISVLMLNDLDTARWTLFDTRIFGRKKNRIKWPIFYLRDLYERFYLASQDKIMVLNDRTVGLVKKYLNRKSEVIRSGIDADLFKFAPHFLPERNEKVILLSHGIFFIHRRYEDTIKALHILKKKGFDVTLTIIGDYENKREAKDYFNKLKVLTQKLGLDSSVTFLGRVSDQDLLNIFEESHIFVSAAHMQTWGLAPFEALSSGLPVAISETIGAAEVLKHKETAVIFKPLDPESQARALEQLITKPDFYQKISRDGNSFVRTYITRQQYGKRMLDVFQSILHKNGQ